jgi:hypothetical protein
MLVGWQERKVYHLCLESLSHSFLYNSLIATIRSIRPDLMQGFPVGGEAIPSNPPSDFLEGNCKCVVVI